MSYDNVDDVLAHFGVKGMKWGVRKERRALRKANIADKEEIKARNRAAEKVASKSDPTFRREVRATRKGKGITVTKADFQVTKKGGLFTGRTLGEFRNSRGERVSEDFANAVLRRAVQKNDRRRRIIQGTAFVGALLLASQAVETT